MEWVQTVIMIRELSDGKWEAEIVEPRRGELRIVRNTKAELLDNLTLFLGMS